MSNRHDFWAQDVEDGQVFRIPPRLTNDDPEFIRWREWCADGRYQCAVAECSNRQLTAVATYTSETGPKAAYLRHRERVHGASERASDGESGHHIAAKQFMYELGMRFGLDAKVEVSISGAGIRRRPDVVWTATDGAQWAIEVQFSDLDPTRWKRRDADLIALGYRTLWLWGVADAGAPGGEERLDIRKLQLGARYESPTDVWVVGAQSPAAYDRDWSVGVAQCHSVGYRWEAERLRTGTPPPWPNALDYDRSLAVEHCPDRGLRCPELEADVATEAAALALRAPQPKATQAALTDRQDRRDETTPAVVATMADTARAADVVMARDPLPLADLEPQSFRCPRCGADAAERFYGPCGPCRSQLRGVA